MSNGKGDKMRQNFNYTKYRDNHSSINWSKKEPVKFSYDELIGLTVDDALPLVQHLVKDIRVIKFGPVHQMKTNDVRKDRLNVEIDFNEKICKVNGIY